MTRLVIEMLPHLKKRELRKAKGSEHGSKIMMLLIASGDNKHEKVLPLRQRFNSTLTQKLNLRNSK